MKKITALSICAISILFVSPQASALEAYSQTQQEQFVDWCTGAKASSESTCSCTVKRLAQTVPPAALAQFLANKGSFTMDATLLSTTAMVTEAFTVCSK